METMENCMILQLDLLEKVEKAHANFKKSPKERISVGYCQGRLETLESYFERFKNTHEIVITNVSSEERKTLAYFTDDVFDDLEERYYTYKGDLKNALQKLNTKPEDLQRPTKTKSCNELQLPSIAIPSFSGDYTEWQSFHDLFTALIDTNPSLQNVQKLHYLKASLKGDAEVLLRQFSITDENYNEAWSVLKKRYDNKRYIANSIFKKLFGQKALPQESAAGLKQLLDTSVECMNALKVLGLPTTHWDAIVNYIVVSKLDTGSHKHWEEKISDDDDVEDFPSFKKLKSFLETRFQTLEMVEPACKSYRAANPKTFHITANDTSRDLECSFCKENHYIFSCKQFAKQSIEERYNFVKNNNLCFNCLIPNHKIFHCKQKTSCQVCGRRHHSLLHREAKQTEEKSGNKTVQTTKKEVTKVVAHVRSSEEEEEESHNVLLATALVGVKSRLGEIHVCRALLDQGSEASFVTARLVELLGLDKTAISGTVSGLGEGNNMCINQRVDLQIMSRYETDFSVRVNAYVLKSLTRSLPAREIKGYLWPQLDNMKLADPTFNKPGRIDILLGADVFSQIIDSGFMRGPGNVIAQHSHLGWILSGNTNTTSFSSQQNMTSFHVTRDVEEDNNLLKNFWEIETESYTNKKAWSKEEEKCEEVYKTTTTRDGTGRYDVHLPLKQGIEDTGKVCGDDKLQKEYTTVVHEYLGLGHMEKVEKEDQEKAIYLPHHDVVQEDRDTKGVRVVRCVFLLKNFWEIETESYTNKKAWSKEEEKCEEVYKTTTTRDGTGRYDVHLPLKQGIEDTGKVCGDDKLQKEYTTVVHEYLGLGHMEKVEKEDQEKAIYLPHHDVVQEDRDTKGVRVVFEASAEGSNGLSLNNAMMIGPPLQPGLRSLIFRWRAHKICVTGDLVKMYRQVKMTDEHTDSQRIELKEEPSEKIESDKLLTVTFGSASTPYLAVRTLSPLADDEAQTCPRAAPVVKSCFYINDLMTGHEVETEIKALCHVINNTSMLKAVGFEMQKWSSNSETMLHFLQDGRTLHESENKLEIKLDKVRSSLGMIKCHTKEEITVNLPESKAPVTKKLIISEVASWLDPFGWLAPVVITAKVMIMIQILCLCSLGWDDELAMDLTEEWMTYRKELHELQTIEIARWIRMTSHCKDVQRYGFPDASWADTMVVFSWLQSQPNRWQGFISNRVSDVIQQRQVQSADNPDIASKKIEWL